MSDEELIERVENPLVRAFLHENLHEFVNDVQVFAEEILAHVPTESKAFVRSSGLAFYSVPMVSFVPDLPWQTIKMAIAHAVSGVFRSAASRPGHTGNRTPGAREKNHDETGPSEQAIVAAFASICKSAEGAMGAILIGGVAHLLGKYIALYTAGILDDVIEQASWPVVQVPSVGPAKTRPAN